MRSKNYERGLWGELVSQGFLSESLSRYLKYVIDVRLWHYGSHFLRPLENKKSSRNERARSFATDILNLINFPKENYKNSYICGAYFGLAAELKSRGVKVCYPPWMGRRSKRFGSNILIKETVRLENILQSKKIDFLISKDFENHIESYKELFAEELINSKIKGLILAYDPTFFERIAIDVCKQVGVPSSVFIHGLPGVYNNIDNHQADKLFVWGEGVRKNYKNIGVDQDVIHIVGHPVYSRKEAEKMIEMSCDKVLVITRSTPFDQPNDVYRNYDRSESVFYLWSVQNVLRRIGVSKAVFRCHPSESPQWYQQYIDNTFYTPDNVNLKDSLLSSSLVITPMSTVFLESLFWGRPVIVFEPYVSGRSLYHFDLVPPFDGQDERVALARTEEELSALIRNKNVTEQSIIHDYISSSFDVTPIIG